MATPRENPRGVIYLLSSIRMGSRRATATTIMHINTTRGIHGIITIFVAITCHRSSNHILRIELNNFHFQHRFSSFRNRQGQVSFLPGEKWEKDVLFHRLSNKSPFSSCLHLSISPGKKQHFFHTPSTPRCYRRQVATTRCPRGSSGFAASGPNFHTGLPAQFSATALKCSRTMPRLRSPSIFRL